MMLLLLACGVENQLDDDKEDPTGVDTGDSWSPPTTADDSGDTADTDGTTITTPAYTCADQSFAGGDVTVDDTCGAVTIRPDWVLTERWSQPHQKAAGGVTIAQLDDDDGDGDVDDDDDVDLLVSEYQGFVSAFRADDGTLKWSTTDGYTEQTMPAVADLDGDGFPEVVVASLEETHAFNGADGTPFWSGRAPVSSKTFCGSLGISDFDADGAPEVFIGRLILDGLTGDEVAEGDEGYGAGIPGEGMISAAADLDGDGVNELIVGNAAYDGAGDTLWASGTDDGFTAVADLDGDGRGEVVSVGTGHVTFLDDDGAVLFETATSDRALAGPATIADFDGDGAPEIAWSTLDEIHLYEADGTERWSTTGVGGSGYYIPLSAFDLDGDGAWELLANDVDALRVFDGATGTVRITEPHASTQYLCAQIPTVGDVDKDGAADIVLAAYGYPTNGELRVLSDTHGFVPARAQWNQDPYHIVNINPDASVPAPAEQNWPAENSFRAGPGYQAATPDLTIAFDGVCEDDCAAGRVLLWLTVANVGTADVTEDVTVRLYGTTSDGEHLLWEGLWTEDLAPGTAGASLQVELTGVPTPLSDLRAEVDADATLPECDETNDVAAWRGFVCT